jgi:tetratricopeptide (TPR) repeat protein
VPFAVYLLAQAFDKLGFDKVKNNFPPDPAEIDLAQIMRLVVNRFLRYCLTDPIDQIRVYTLALLRVRDDVALRAIWQLPDAESPRDILSNLQARYGFIQPDYTLHDVIRDFLRAHFRSDDRDTASRLGALAVAHFLPRWQAETSAMSTLKERLTEERWRTLTFDTLNALAWEDEPATLRFLAERVLEVQVSEPGLAKILLSLVQEFRLAPDWWHSRTNRFVNLLAQTSAPDPAEALAALETLQHDYNQFIASTHQALIHLQRAICLTRQKRWETALRACQEAELSFPADSSLQLVLAETYRQVGINLCTQFLDIASSANGKIDSNSTSYKQAFFAITRATELNPECIHCRGCIYSGIRNYSAALADFAKAIELQPENSLNYFMRGRIYFDLQNYPAAQADFTKVIELQPEDGDAYHLRGRVYFEIQNYPAAQADFTKVIELRPEDGGAYHWCGRVYFQMQNYSAALADFSKAIELQPEDENSYHLRGRVYFEMQNYSAALADFSKAIELNPQDANNYHQRAHTQIELKSPEAALADFGKAIELKIEDSTNYFCRGRANYGMQNYPAAQADFSKAIELQPEDGYYYAWLGKTYLATRQFSEAQVTFSHAEEFVKDKGEMAYSIAGCYALLPQPAEACVWLHHAIETDKEYLKKYQTDNDFDLVSQSSDFKALLKEYEFLLQ